MDAEFFRGLILFTLICSSPIIAAWAWKKYQDRKAARYVPKYLMYDTHLKRWIVTDYFLTELNDYQGVIAAEKAIVQKRKDDHIFNTVKEYRHDVG